MDLAAAGLPSPVAGLATTAPAPGAPGLRRKMGGLAAVGLPGADAGLGTAVVGEGAPVTSRDIAQQARREAAAKYEARYQERINRMQSATTPAAVEAILTQEEYQDPERHIAGTHKVEQAAKDAKRQLAAEATRAEAEAQGKWVTLPGFYRRGTRGELQAELEALPQEAGFEYQLGRGYSPFGSNGQDNDFVIERRKVAAPEAANSPAGVVSSEAPTEGMNSSAMPISSPGMPAGAGGPAGDPQRLPWQGASTDDQENRWYGSRVRLTAQDRRRAAAGLLRDGEAELVRVLNDGKLLEVRWPGTAGTHRAATRDYEIEVVALADNQAEAAAPVARPATPDAAATPSRPSPGRYQQGEVASREGQMTLAHRASRTALLTQLNDRAGNPYTEDELINAADERMDAIRDYLIAAARGGDTPEASKAGEEAHVDPESGERNPVTAPDPAALAQALRAGDLSVAGYWRAMGLAEDDLPVPSAANLPEARARVPYLALMDEARALAGTLGVAKRALAELEVIEREYENPFTTRLAAARSLPPLLRQRFKTRFAAVEAGDAAKRQYQDAKDAAYREQVIVEAERLFEQSETAANLQTPPGQAEPTAKQGPFGPIFRQFYHDAQGAIAHLRQTETGEAVAALHHPEVGDIDLVWGHTSDDPRATGEGLAKLARWHPEVLDDLQGFIDSLHVHQKHKNYIHLTDSKDRRGAVRLDYNGQTKTWLLTAYEVGKQGVRSAPGGISASAGMKDATILATASGASDTSSIDDSKSARVILEMEPEDAQHSPITVEINQVNRWVNALSDADYATLDAAMADSHQARFPYGATLTADPQQVQAIWEKELAKQGAKAAIQAETQPAPQDVPTKLENFGAELPPRRRKLAAKLTEALADDDIARQPLSKIWPAAENEGIEDTFAAAVAFAARARIPNKPRDSGKLARWVAQVKQLRDLAGLIVSGQVTREQFLAERQRAFPLLRDWEAQVRLLEQLDREHWPRIADVHEAPDARKWHGPREPATPSPYVTLKIDGQNRIFNDSGDMLRHLDAIKALLGEPAATQKLKFEIRLPRSGEVKAYINKAGDGERRRLMTFASVEEARAALKDRYDDLVTAWEAVKARDNITERDLRGAVNRPRTGQDWRQGRDITTEDFADQFGFRGGEFGQWMKQGRQAQERQAYLNSAYDALMDLADILGVPPKALSLNGTLGIAFGARGSGWAAAHYEPDTLIINLTKPRGAGSMAHEFFHALDNYFARARGNAPKFTGDQDAYRDQNFITYRPERLMVKVGAGRMTPITATRLAALRQANPNARQFDPENWIPDPAHPEGVRPEVEARFAALVETLNAAPMLDRARRLDGRKSGEGYWSRVIERAARAFENYVMKRMLDQGYVNDFLANVLPADEIDKNDARYPYLLPDEIAPIAAAFDELLGTLQTREDDAGNVALFSKRPQGKQTSPLTIEDAEYLAAVQRGDMETARRLVDEAARAAGYSVAGWHGSRGWGFSVFKTGSEGGVHFGTLPQAEMRGGRGNARRFWLKMESTARLRDRGQFKAIPRGRDSAIYLNRYEGISVETVESIPGAVLDRLTDAQFKKRVPEAADSQLVKYAWQIKSADPVTYDDNGQVIPLSQRFDPDNDDIRFAKSAHAPGAGGSVTAITQAVRRLMRPWANAPRPVVFQGMNDPQVDAEVRQAYAEESARRQAEDPKAKPDLVEGFYFRGKVYINAEAVRTVADLERVLRHETLGHAGLRGLFGGPELDALLDRMARARRGEVAAMATARGLDMMDQTQRRQAAEEVLAELAQTRPEIGWVRELLAIVKAKLREWGVLDANKLSDAEMLREYVIPARNFIERGRRAAGAMPGAAVPAFAKVTQDNLADEERQRQAVEARYAVELRAHDEEGEPLLAPNGQPSKLNRRQWVEVRTENFKRWFGDWEIAATQDWLDKGDPVAVMEGNEVPKLAKLTDLAIWVAQNWQSRLGANAVTHPQLGAVTLDRKAVGTSLAHGFGPEKMQALYLVPQALAAGRVLGSLPREQNKPEAIMVAAPVEIGGRLYRMLMEVRRDANMQRLYVHEVILREAPSAAAFISSAGPQGLKPQGAGRGAIWKFMQGLRDVQAASSKVVDANGEPLLIYHGTQSDFSKFNNELVKSRFPYSIGLHFTDRPGEAGIYADGWENHAVNWNPQAKFAVPVAEGANIMPVFVRATNPLAIDAGPQSASTKVDMDRAEIIAQLLAARQNGTPYDGVIAKRAVGDDYDGINVIVFDPTQIKSAIGNTGAFDPTNPDVRFSLARDADAGGSPLGGGKAFLDSVRQWLGDSWQGRVASENYSVLGALTLRQLAEVGAKWLPGMQLYDRLRTTMETRRNVMMEEAGRLGDGVDSWARKHPAEARAVFELENETTLAQVDPSDYQVLMIPLKLGPGPEMLRNWAATAENVQELRKRSRAWRRSKQVRERELAAYYSAAADKLNLALRAERRRQAALPELARKWAALSSGPQHRGADGAPFATEQAARAALTARRWPKGVVTVVEAVPGGWAIQELGGQQVYTRMRDLYKKRSDEMLAALIKRLDSLGSLDEASKQALAARIRVEFENPMDEKGNPRVGPYFPLQRFGRFYLTARRLPTGEARTWRRQDGEPFPSEQAARSALGKRADLQGVSAKVVPLEDGTGFVLEEVPEFGFWLAESVGERRKLAAELVAEGWRIQGQGLTAQAHKELQGVSEGFMAEAVTQLQEQGAKDEADMLYQMYLQTLTQMSIRKHFIHRKGTTGYTADQLRAYGWNMTRLAHQVSKLEHLPNLERVIRDIEAELQEAKRASQGLDTTRQNALLEELKKRHDWVANPENAPWTNALSALGFVFYLGVSPAAALVNLSQVPIVGLPVLAARYGSWGAAAKGLTTAFVDVARGFNPAVLKGFITGRPLPSDAANLTEEERRAFAEWDKTGARDRTQAHNLAGIGDADNWLNGPTFNRVMGAVSSLFHAAEVVNRDTTLLAGYRLGRAKGLGHETAVMQAEEDNWTINFDYANANRARMMQGNVAKVLLMFKNYSQHVLYFLGRNLFLSVKGESAEVKREARTKFAGFLGMTALFAGAAGLPVGGLFVMANLIQGMFGDDDEPWDAEIEFRNWLANTFPEGVSDVLDRGAVNTLTGLDFSSRVSIGDLIWRAPDRDLDGAGMFQHVVEQMLGPVGGLAARPFTMYDELREGRWVRAAEAASPKFLRDLVQSGRFAEEGVLTRKGAEILAPGELSSYELFAKALGMNPDDLAVRYQQNSAIKLYEQRITDRRRVLVAAAAMAIMAKDTQGQAAAREKIAAFNKVHPEIKISVETLKRSVRAREMMRERAKGGIAINPKLDYLREQAGGFGEQPAEDEEEEG